MKLTTNQRKELKQGKTIDINNFKVSYYNDTELDWNYYSKSYGKPKVWYNHYLEVSYKYKTEKVNYQGKLTNNILDDMLNEGITKYFVINSNTRIIRTLDSTLKEGIKQERIDKLARDKRQAKQDIKDAKQRELNKLKIQALYSKIQAIEPKGKNSLLSQLQHHYNFCLKGIRKYTELHNLDINTCYTKTQIKQIAKMLLKINERLNYDSDFKYFLNRIIAK